VVELSGILDADLLNKVKGNCKVLVCKYSLFKLLTIGFSILTKMTIYCPERCDFTVSTP